MLFRSGRFLFCFPQDLRGTRIYDPNSNGFDTEKREAFNKVIQFLLRFPKADKAEPTILHTIRMSKEALEVHVEEMNRIEKEQSPDGSLRLYSDWASKLAGRVARIACILHCVVCAELNEDPTNHLISEPLVKASWGMGLYFIDHMSQAYQLTISRESDILAERIMSWVRRKQKTEITQREVMQFCNTDSKSAKEALTKLCETYHLQFVTVENATTGRKKDCYKVNPDSLKCSKQEEPVEEL